MVARSLAILAILLVTIASGLRPAAAAVETIDIGQLSVPGDQVSYGPRPSLSFYLPVYRSVRAIRFIATVRVSAAVDGHSTVTVSSDGVPRYTESVEALRRNPIINVALPLPRVPLRTIDVSISGAFVHIDDDICSRFDPSSLYLLVDGGSGFAVTTGPTTPTIAGFLESYTGNVAIVAPANLSPQRRLSAIGLAYLVEQLYHWRHARAELRTTPDPSAKNIVLGDFTADLTLRGNQLEVGPQGDALLTRDIDPLLITVGVASAQFTPAAADRSASRLILGDLGMTTQTQTGTNPNFSIPFSIGLLGGIPNGLRMSVNLAHTAIDPGQHGTVSLTINGALVDSLPLSSPSGRQTADFAIPSDLIASANDVRVQVDYDVTRDCHAIYPNVTTTLFDDTAFSWTGVTPYAFSVGDFFRSASGKVVVLVDGDANVSYAFTLLSTLGMGNTNITSVDVLPFDGTVPKGYDAAIVVAGLDRLAAWQLPLASNQGHFVLGDGAPPLTADFADPFGVLETTKIDGTQTLVASYWRDAQPTVGMDRIAYETLATQTGRVFMYRGDQNIYASTAPRKREASQSFLTRAVVPVALTFLLLLVLVIVLARRKRTGGSMQ